MRYLKRIKAVHESKTGPGIGAVVARLTETLGSLNSHLNEHKNPIQIIIQKLSEELGMEYEDNIIEQYTGS